NPVGPYAGRYGANVSPVWKANTHGRKKTNTVVLTGTGSATMNGAPSYGTANQTEAEEAVHFPIGRKNDHTTTYTKGTLSGSMVGSAPRPDGRKGKPNRRAT